jgi:cholesterol transport system auxiliary component
MHIRAWAWLPLLLLSACVSGLKSNLPAVQTYVLQPQVAGVAGVAGVAPAPGTSLQVQIGSVAPGLASDGIALLRPGQRLDYYSGARWAASAPAMISALAIDALRAQQRFSMVQSEGGPFATNAVLNLDVQHFEAVYSEAGAPSVHVLIVATLGRHSEGAVTQELRAESRVTADADRMQAVMAAFDRATAQALAQLAQMVQPPTPER